MGCDMGATDLCVTSPAAGVQVSKSGSHTPPGLPLDSAGPSGTWSKKQAEGEGKPEWRMGDRISWKYTAVLTEEKGMIAKETGGGVHVHSAEEEGDSCARHSGGRHFEGLFR